MTTVLSRRLSSPITSADLNKQVFAYARQKARKEKVDFIACDFANLPLRDNTFCCITCDLVITTSENALQDQMLTEFKRTLRRKSKLHITNYYPLKDPRTIQDKLTAETSKLYIAVAEHKGIMSRPVSA